MYCELLKAARDLRKHSEWLLAELEDSPNLARKKDKDIDDYICEEGMPFFIFRYIQLDFCKIYKKLEGKDKSRNLQLFHTYDSNPSNFTELRVMSKDV